MFEDYKIFEHKCDCGNTFLIMGNEWKIKFESFVKLKCEACGKEYVFEELKNDKTEYNSQKNPS